MSAYHSEELIQEFFRALLREGVPSSQASRHRDKLRFFLHGYLLEEWPRDLERVESDLLRDFLGEWFFHNVSRSKTDLLSYLYTFRRFYDFLYHSGRISAPEHEEILSLCENPEYLFLRFEELQTPELDPAADLVAGRPGIAQEDFFLPGVSAICRRLFLVLNNLPAPKPPAGLDFALFLDYLASFRIRLTPSRGELPASHLARVNHRFSRPELVPPRSSQRKFKRLHWFFHLAQVLRLVESKDDYSLQVLPRATAFLDMEPLAQLALIIDATWNLLPWARLGSPQDQRVSQLAQEHRDGFASLLADLPADHEWLLELNPEDTLEETLLSRYLHFHEVVQNHILFALAETGILAYTTRAKDDPSPLKIRSLTLSRQGKQIMKLLARQHPTSRQTTISPLKRLQECLLL